ncbi:cytochrome p450 [Trifolium pratense]|uniref:Cytochrome p450 n=1 Tax=Trifolium pratense TaxID=57577 RepID=A0A2K3P6R6_TRIPR|nr:cytochrome p450 [Trifolium pratense]
MENWAQHITNSVEANKSSSSIPVNCAMCNGDDEDITHIYSGVRERYIAGSMRDCGILNILDKAQQELLTVMAWSIWKGRNNQVWNNTSDSCQTVLERALHLITSWRNAQQLCSLTHVMQLVQQQTYWSKPRIGRYKCNIDASFSMPHNKVGVGMCIRDDKGQFVAARTEWIEPTEWRWKLEKPWKDQPEINNGIDGDKQIQIQDQDGVQAYSPQNDAENENPAQLVHKLSV